MKKWIVIIIIGIILIIIAIVITIRIDCEEPCTATWEAVVEVDEVPIPLTPGRTIYTLYQVTVTTDVERTLEINGTAFTGVTATPLTTSYSFDPGETTLYDSVQIDVDGSATPALDVVCVVVNESGCEISDGT